MARERFFAGRCGLPGLDLRGMNWIGRLEVVLFVDEVASKMEGNEGSVVVDF